MRWLDQVLEPLQLPEPQKQRLSAALALTLGGEAIMVMKDVCKLNNAEAKAVLRWSALALLRAAMEESKRVSSYRLVQYPVAEGADFGSVAAGFRVGEEIVRAGFCHYVKELDEPSGFHILADKGWRDQGNAGTRPRQELPPSAGCSHRCLCV